MAVKTFSIYSAIVSLSLGEGVQPSSRVLKTDLTPPELAILAQIHGPEGLPPEHIVKTGEESFNENELRNALAEKYDTFNVNGRKILAEQFGAMGSLPTTAEDALGIDPPVEVDEDDREEFDALALQAAEAQARLRAEEDAKKLFDGA